MFLRSLRLKSASTPLLPSLLVGGIAFALAACAPEFDTSSGSTERGSLGQEVYSVLCDRIGAGELREDLTGASFRGICHDDGAGFQDEIDTSQLPPLVGDAENEDGEIVTLEEQELERERRMRRIETFGAKRDSIIAAIDAIIPDSEILVRTLVDEKTGLPDPTKSSCNPADEKGSLHTELAALLGNFGKLYNDGTIPQATQAMARTLAVFRDNDAAREAWGRLAAREGYRPASVGLGLVRPFAAYPNLRELLNALIASISADSRPYEEVQGIHIPTPGPSYPRFLKLLEVASHELNNATADPTPAPLVASDDANAGLVHLSRPRQNLELMEALMLAEDPEFGGGAPRYIVRRDGRGLARVLPDGGSLPPLFVDTNDDGLPDIDDAGHFLTSDGSRAPTPFPVPGLTDSASRDNFGRATLGGQLAYAYVDTSHTFTASLLADALPLFQYEPSLSHETMMDMMAGLYVVAGARDEGEASSKTFADGSVVSYSQFKRDRSPLLDLVHAVTQLMAEPAVDDTLLVAKKLAQENEADLARVLKATLDGRDIAMRHPEAQLPKQSVLWDDLFEILGRISKEPGLLEDLLDSMTHDDTELLGTLLGKWAIYKDEFSYNRSNLDGPAVNVTANVNSDPVTLVDPSAPDTGDNRSMLQRFLQLMNDGRGVASCNRAGAQVKARAFGVDVTVPPFGGNFQECAVYKVPDLDVFLLQAMVQSPKAQLFIRDDKLRNGQWQGLGRTTVGLMEDSSGMRGFYGEKDSTSLFPTAAWLARKVFFDLDETGQNERTRGFIEALDGKFTGSSVCPERVIDDPCANGGCNFGGDVPIPNDVAADGKVRGLRSCKNGDWLAQRNKNTLFMMERLDGYRAFTPLANAFVMHDREDLFIDLSIILHKHWQSSAGTADECRTKDGPCGKSNASSYQGLLGELLVKDMIPSLMQIMRTAKATTVKHCTSTSSDGRCTASEDRNGIQVLAEAARAMFDPSRAAQVDLRDRLGNTKTRMNDGTEVAQTTPAYLLTNALASFDDAYDAYEAAHPDDAGRRPQFRRARSQLADQFLAISGNGAQARFARRGVIKILPIVIDLLRSQTWANCPKTFGGGNLRCNWAREELPNKLEDTMTGPLFASMMDLVDGVRRDDRARFELQRAMVYLLDTASQNDALPAMLASSNDMVQLLRDDRNMLPFFKVLAAALSPSGFGEDKQGLPAKSLIDSTLAMLGKISGRYENVDANDNLEEICSREIDPNQVLNVLLGTAVTPADSLGGKAPIEILLDVIADVNRVAPEQPKPYYDEADYAAIAATTVDFLTNEERGMEQFYEIVRKGQERK